MVKQIHKAKWNASPSYRKWTALRDQALEQLHTRAQLETADILRKLLTDTLLAAKASYHQLQTGHPNGIETFERILKSIFVSAAGDIYQVMIRLKIRSYVLSKSSETEIIARLKSGTVVSSISAQKLDNLRKQSSRTGGEIWQRVNLYVDRMRRKITSFAQGAALNAPDQESFLIDVMQAFPRPRIVKRPKRILKLVKEADQISKKPPADVAIDNIDDATWRDMLDAYKDEYVPRWRSPEFVVGLPITDPTIQVDGTEVWYAWEFERDMTHEFVQAVRDGQIDSARENGITDFVVISVIDDRTCDNCCGNFGCVDFDGLLVTEVEKLTGGDQSAPPFHYACRCTLAPATENIPDKPDTGASEFDDWLLS